jgi:hypothetical protein
MVLGLRWWLKERHDSAKNYNAQCHFLELQRRTSWPLVPNPEDAHKALYSISSLDSGRPSWYYVLAFVALEIPFDSFNKAARTNLRPFVSAG